MLWSKILLLDNNWNCFMILNHYQANIRMKQSHKKLKKWTCKSIRTNYQEHCQEVTKENFQSQWLWLEILTLSSSMNHQLVWILKQEDSCGKSFQELLHKRNNRQSFWQHTLWKKLKHFLLNWVSWSVVTSNVSVHLNTSNQNMVMDTKLKLRWIHVLNNRFHNIWHKVNLRIKIQLRRNNLKDSLIIWKLNKLYRLKFRLKEVETIFTIR